MDQATIQRYQQDGDIYRKLVSQYGISAADSIAAAARNGDRAALTEEIARVRSGPARNESTLSILTEQLTTNPLAAPLDGANRILGNTFLSFLKNPWVLVALAAVAFFAMGGGPWIAKKMFGKR